MLFAREFKLHFAAGSFLQLNSEIVDKTDIVSRGRENDGCNIFVASLQLWIFFQGGSFSANVDNEWNFPVILTVFDFGFLALYV